MRVCHDFVRARRVSATMDDQHNNNHLLRLLHIFRLRKDCVREAVGNSKPARHLG
jgi:hypothetical protein